LRGFVAFQVMRGVVASRGRPPLSASQAAAELGVTTSTVRRWVANGDLRAVRLGAGPLARIRIPAEALRELLRPAATGHEEAE
jgi:excisionase family DNA binding protein